MKICVKARLEVKDMSNQYIKMTKVAQNKALRVLARSRIIDRRSIKEMLDKFNMLSVNQTMAQVKITKAWKANKDKDYPVKMKQERNYNNGERRVVRPGKRREMKEGGKNKIAVESFTRDVGRLWNRAPDRKYHISSLNYNYWHYFELFFIVEPSAEAL